MQGVTSCAISRVRGGVVAGVRSGAASVVAAAVVLVAAIAALAAFVPGQAQAGSRFTDVPDDAWYVTGGYLDFVVDNGIMGGYTDQEGQSTGNFGPDDQLTRAQVATILFRAANPGDVTTIDPHFYSGAQPFPDVEPDLYYTAAVDWCVKNGVVTGYTNQDGTAVFLPDAPVSREALATMIYRYCTNVVGVSTAADYTGFSRMVDVGDVSDWAYDAMGWCYDHGILTGFEGIYLAPDYNASRCQATKMFSVSLQLPPVGKVAYALLYQDGTFVMQYGLEPDPESDHGKVLSCWEDIENLPLNEVPWAGCADQVTSVVIRDDIKPTYMAGWFAGMTLATSFESSNFHATTVTDLSYCFESFGAATDEGADTIVLDHWYSKKCTTTEGMFADSKFQGIQWEGFYADSLVDASSMFEGAHGLEGISVARSVTPKLQKVDNMFAHVEGNTLTLDLSGWDTTSVTSYIDVFEGTDITSVAVDEKLTLTGSIPSGEWFDDAGQLCETIPLGASGIFSKIKPTANATLYEDGALVFQYGTSGADGHGDAVKKWEDVENLAAGVVPWSSSRSKVTSVVFVSDIRPVTMSGWFAWMSNATSFVTGPFTAEGVRDLSRCFAGFGSASGAGEADLSGWKVGCAASLEGMFDGAGFSSIDVHGWDLTSATTAARCFADSKYLKTVDMSGWTAPVLTDASGLFYGDSGLKTADLSKFISAALTTADEMFAGAGNALGLDLSGWDTTSVKSYDAAFDGANLSLLTVGEKFTMSFEVPSGPWYLLDGTYVGDFPTDGRSGTFTTAAPTPCALMYSDGALVFQIGKVVDSSHGKLVAMWEDVAGLTEGEVPWSEYMVKSIEFKDDFSVTSMAGWFAHLGNVVSFKTGPFTAKGVEDLTDCFAFFASATDGISLDLSSWDVSGATKLDGMFRRSGITELDLGKWDTSAAASTKGVFDDCNWLGIVTLGEKCTLGASLPNKPWYGADGTEYTPATIPTGTTATFYAEKPMVDEGPVVGAAEIGEVGDGDDGQGQLVGGETPVAGDPDGENVDAGDGENGEGDAGDGEPAGGEPVVDEQPVVGEPVVGEPVVQGPDAENVDAGDGEGTDGAAESGAADVSADEDAPEGDAENADAYEAGIAA